MKLTQRLAHRAFAMVALTVATMLAANGFAQTEAGRAEVRAVKGTASYTVAGGPPTALKVGTVLTGGAVIKTGPESTVDLFMGKSAGVLRVTENTTLGLDKLNMTDTGAETVVEIQLNVPSGTILGNVNKLSAASKYEIKLPNGVAGIRGTRFRCSSTSYIVLLNGTLVFVFVPPGGQPTPYTLVAPPAVYFSPLEGIKPAPPELVREVTDQISKAPRGPLDTAQPAGSGRAQEKSAQPGLRENVTPNDGTAKVENNTFVEPTDENRNDRVDDPNTTPATAPM